MKSKSSKKWIWLLLIIIIMGIVSLSVYLLKPWIPPKYRNPLFCDESVGCRNYGRCVNEYHGSDEWIVLGGPGCTCNLTENKCIIVPYSPPQYKKPEISDFCSSDNDCVLVETDECNNGIFYDEVCINSSSVNTWNNSLEYYKRQHVDEGGRIKCPKMQLESKFFCICFNKKCITNYVSLSLNVTRNYTLSDINRSTHDFLKNFIIK